MHFFLYKTDLTIEVSLCPCRSQGEGRPVNGKSLFIFFPIRAVFSLFTSSLKTGLPSDRLLMAAAFCDNEGTAPAGIALSVPSAAVPSHAVIAIVSVTSFILSIVPSVAEMKI